ncbi:hypothetical protein Dimus_032560 [Dionaea muscipula]
MAGLTLHIYSNSLQPYFSTSAASAATWVSPLLLLRRVECKVEYQVSSVADCRREPAVQAPKANFRRM